MFSTDGVFLFVGLPAIPVLNAMVSANANAGLWQLAQLTVESLDKIFSENNFLPNRALLYTGAVFSSNRALSNSTKATNEEMRMNSLFMITKLQRLRPL